MPEIFSQNPRSWIIRIVFILMAAILISRLFVMQVVEDKYEVMANNQAIVRRVIYPARGIIVDRTGKSLLENKVSYDLAVTPAKIKNLDTAMFCNIMELTKPEFELRMKRLVGKNGSIRQSIFENYIDNRKNAKLQENIYLFEGFDLIERTTRVYPLKIGSAFLGYLNEVSPRMLKHERYASYRQGDYVGITGLENVYEEVLRGQRGVQFMVRDVLNRPQDSYKHGSMDTMPVAGKNLELYLDADLQVLGEKLMNGKIGSIVAIDPQTGGILSMVSGPSYDPNLLSGGDFGKNYYALAKDYTIPLYNKATQATYSPGSTFKPCTALIGLDVGAITPSFGYPCRGGYYACGRRIGCTHSNPGHAANLRIAMANSCNSYFCDVFRRTVDLKKWKGGVHEGVQIWHNYLNSFGLGHPLGVDITGESAGNIPDSAYFDKLYNNHWNSCNMVVVGMGQGEVDLTPLQMANVMAMIANRGYYYTPHFVKAIDGNKKDLHLAPYLKKHEVTHIPDSAFNAVILGMEDVVEKGTGKVAQLPGVAVCGKTGTVENYASIGGVTVKLDNHSVFVCFAPKDNPKIAIAVVVANAGYGATWAGPIASLMMEKYLTDTIKRTALADRMFQANTIKKYVYTIDSLNRQKDNLRQMLKTADKRTRDSIKNYRDTQMVRQILKDYYHLKIK